MKSIFRSLRALCAITSNTTGQSRRRADRTDLNGNRVFCAASSMDQSNDFERYERARRKMEIAQMKYVRDGLCTDMRRIESSLRNATDKRQIARLEERWRWLNSRVCEIEKAERDLCLPGQNDNQAKTNRPGGTARS